MIVPPPENPFFEQLRRAAGGQKVDWTAVKADWLAQLERLFARFDAWLAPAEQQRLLVVKRFVAPIREEHLGAYQVPTRHLLTPDQRVIDIIPQYGLVIGALGRVEFLCGARSATLVQRAADDWHFAVLRNTWADQPLTETSFMEMLARLLGQLPGLGE